MSNERLWSGATPEEVSRDLSDLVDFTDEGLPLPDLEKMLSDRLLPHLIRYGSPSFHSLFNMMPEEGALHGARLALEWNQGVTNWQVSPGGAVLEELCCRALCRLFGLGEEAEGTVMYSGTYANQQALYMALHRRAEEEGFNLAETGIKGFRDPGRLAVITSVDSHFSLRHAVRMLGLGEEALVMVGVDDNRRMDAGQLREILADLTDERDVFCVVATAGTTSTGSVDPVGEIVKICASEGIWLHVDGAYGLAYQLVPEWSHLFTGIDQADSLSWDPHKQFGVPIPSSIIFARNPVDLRRMAIFSSYWNLPDTVEPNPGIKSIPSTRPLTALPIVTSIRHLGLQGVRERLRAPLEVIREIHRQLEAEPDMECLHLPDTGILCFRVRPEGVREDRLNSLQQHIYDTILSDGRRSISISEMDGISILRLVVLSPTVTVESVRETIAEVRNRAETFS